MGLDMNRHEDRILRVIAYIHDNPAADLSLDRLAEVAAMSRFHWHRLFRAMTGETCAAAVKRLRMHRAATLVVQSNLPLAEIGARVAYPDPASFSRAFSNIFGVPPSTFRSIGKMPLDTTRIQKGDHQMHDVEIREMPPFRLAALAHQGAYPEISRAFESLYAILVSRGLLGKIGNGIAIYHDDPSSLPESELRSHAAVTLNEGTPVPNGLEPYNLPGGRAAVLTYKGPYAGLPTVYDYLYGSWLANSQEEPAAHPSYEVYLNDPSQTAPEDLVTEVCIPLSS